MTESKEEVVIPEARTHQSGHVSHHKSRRRKRIAARTLLILALIVGLLAVCDFAYNAYGISDCLEARSTDESGNSTAMVTKTDCHFDVIAGEERQRLDAATAVVAVALLISGIVISRRTRRHRR